MAKTRDAMVASAKALGGFQNSTFATDATWAEWIERGIQDLWEKLSQTMGAEYFATEATISLVDGTKDYDLPANFYSMIGCRLTIDNKEVNLEKFNWSDEAQLLNVTYLERRKYYRIIGASTQSGSHQIRILPEPQAATTLTYRYVYKPVFANGSATFDGINGWEEYAELIAAIKATTKDESDPTMLVMDLNRVSTRIDRNKVSRDKNRPGRIQDTRKDGWRTIYNNSWNDLV